MQKKKWIIPTVLLISGVLTAVAVWAAQGDRSRTVNINGKQVVFNWTDSGGLNSRGEDLLQSLSSAYTHGLNPESYQATRLKKIAESQSLGQEKYEAMLEEAALTYARHLSRGYTNPKQQYRAGITQKPFDKEYMLEQLHTNHDLQDTFEKMAPQTESYQHLRRVLAEYLQQEKHKDWPQLKTTGVVNVGQSSPDVAVARELLSLHGYYDRNAKYFSYFKRSAQKQKDAEAANVLDEELSEAIKIFQENYNIEADGALGPETRSALNVSDSERIREIVLTLERMRWMPNMQGVKRYVTVNIPSYRLTGYVDGQPDLVMRVIVGKVLNNTPLFSSEINEVVFNPYWNIPTSIASKETLPKLQKNPGYLQASNLEVLDRSSGKVISAPNWSTVSAEGMNNYFVRQKPGAGNALGRIKFRMPNNQAIYLHDTPNDKLFEKSQRDFSHGCIRLQQPERFGSFVLPNMNESDVRAKLDTGQHVAVSVDHPVPTHLTYWTVWVDEGGNTRFAKDIYNLNSPLATDMKSVLSFSAFQN